MHLAADPVAGVAFDDDSPAGHLAAEVASGIAVDVDLARAHPIADKVHAGQVSLEVDPAVGRIARDSEHLGQRQFAVAVEDLEPLDLGERLLAQPVGNDPLDLDGNGWSARGISGRATSRRSSDPQREGGRGGDGMAGGDPRLSDTKEKSMSTQVGKPQRLPLQVKARSLREVIAGV